MANSCRSRVAKAPRALAAALALLALASCSSPASPGGATSISITGTTVLATVGQTTQLTARDGSGVDVTSRAAWQTSNVGVATVSSGGLVTATGIGTAAVGAAYQQATAAVTIVVGPQPPITLSSCGPIVRPGTYILAADLPSGAVTAPCINITNTSGVSLDCRGHAPGEVGLATVSNVSLTNCAFDEVTGSGLTDVTVTASTMRTWSTQGQQTRIILNGNHITSNGVSMVGAQSALIENNTFDSFLNTTFYAVHLMGGSNNEVSGNTIDGGYDGQPNNDGLDDGVILINEANDRVDHNTIRDCYDTAVEGLGSLATTTISANTGVNIGIAGVGAYWCTNWSGNVISGNDISRSPALMHVEYMIGPRCASPQAPAMFSGNQIIGNRFHDPAPGVQSVGTAPRMYVVFADALAVTSNAIAGDDFGSEPGPQLSPLAGFIDGGNNVCAPLTASLPANFACGSSGTAVARRVRRH